MSSNLSEKVFPPPGQPDKSPNVKSWETYTSTFNLTTLGPLDPIKDLIFQILIEEIPLTLIRVSKYFYDLITPGLYENLEIDNENFQKLFLRFLIPTRMKVDEDQSKPSTSKEQKKQEIIWKIGSRKPDLFKLVKTITFIDAKSVEKFFKKVKTFDQINHSNGIKSFVRIFTGVKHVRFGHELLASLATDFTGLRRSFMFRMTYYGLVDYLEEIMFHCQPHSICFEWPSLWERDEKFFNAEDENDIMEPTLAYAFDDLVEELLKHNSKDDIQFRIHIHSFYLEHEATCIFSELSRDIAVIFDMDDGLRESPGDHLILSLWSHYIFSDLNEKPKVEYFVWETEKAREELDRLSTSTNIENKSFASRVHTTKEKEMFCPCCI